MKLRYNLKFKVNDLIVNDFKNWKGDQVWRISDIDYNDKCYCVEYLNTKNPMLGIIYFDQQDDYCLAIFNANTLWRKLNGEL
jgi:hypothetical protein